MEKQPRFLRTQPQYYRIVVAGPLDEKWSDRLGGMSIELHPEASGDFPLTVLQGQLTDQAQLSGILNILCDLRLPLLKVELIAEVD